MGNLSNYLIFCCLPPACFQITKYIPVIWLGLHLSVFYRTAAAAAIINITSGKKAVIEREGVRLSNENAISVQNGNTQKWRRTKDVQRAVHRDVPRDVRETFANRSGDVQTARTVCAVVQETFDSRVDNLRLGVRPGVRFGVRCVLPNDTGYGSVYVSRTTRHTV